MANGRLKWWNSQKGFGFIIPDQGGSDVFVHITALEKSGIRDLKEGDRVSYDLESNRGRTCACNLMKE